MPDGRTKTALLTSTNALATRAKTAHFVVMTSMRTFVYAPLGLQGLTAKQTLMSVRVLLVITVGHASTELMSTRATVCQDIQTLTAMSI